MASPDYDHDKASTKLEKPTKRPSDPDEQDRITTANQLNSPILRLPGELRTKIYTYVCLSTIVKHGDPASSSDMDRVFTKTFLFTCKQFYSEAIKLMHSRATFDFDGLSSLKNLNPEYRQLITSVQVGVEFALNVASLARGSRVKEEFGHDDPTECLPGAQKFYVRGRLWTRLSWEFGVFFNNRDVKVTGDRAPIT